MMTAPPVDHVIIDQRGSSMKPFQTSCEDFFLLLILKASASAIPALGTVDAWLPPWLETLPSSNRTGLFGK
jgi:hypothetical protein